MWYKVTKEQYDAFHAQGGTSSMILNILDIDGEVHFGTEKPEGDYWVRDPDTLDTWFSSALWTFSTLGWPNSTKELEYFHPTNVLETGYDILFFWVARMILSTTYALRKDGLPEEKCVPFKTVYLHGLIRDRHGKKMSKSNPETCIDPLDMIEKYGADALRLSLVIGSTPGNDMSLYEEKIAGYRNFINKIWNASRFALMNVSKADLQQEFTAASAKSLADKWILTELQDLTKAVDKDFAKHRYSDAGTKIYDFLWREYCDWYLEMSKGDQKNPLVLIQVLKTTLALLHPFVPFVTEKIWEFLDQGGKLIDHQWPQFDKSLSFKDAAASMNLIKETISSIRSLRAEAKVEPAKKIKAVIYGGEHTGALEQSRDIIMRLARLEELELSETGDKLTKSKATFLTGIEIYLPLEGLIDLDKEKERLQKEIQSKQKFLKGLVAKLKNKSFVDNAPEAIVEQQKQRQQEEQENLNKLEKQLQDLV